MNVFWPSFAGTVKIRTPAAEFLERFHRRVDAGLLTGKPHRRAHYVVTRHSDRELAFRADDWLTAINIGLNRVELRIPSNDRLEFVVTYRKWATFAVGFGVGLGALIGGSLSACFFFLPTMRDDIAAKNGAAVFWGSVVFWGFIWPWLLSALLIPLHKRFAARALVQIIDQVDTQADPVLASVDARG